MTGSQSRSPLYQLSSGPKAIRATTMRGSDKNRPNCEPRADHATPRAAFPASNIRCPGNSDNAVSPSGAPISADGM